MILVPLGIKWPFFTGVTRSRNGYCLGLGPFGNGWDPSYTSPSHLKGFWPRITNSRDMGIFLIFALISSKIENMNKRLFGVLFLTGNGSKLDMICLSIVESNW